MGPQDMERRFGYHRPDEKRGERHGEWRDAARALAERAVELVPAGRELALVLTSIEEAMFWGNAGIARQGYDEAQAGPTAGHADEQLQVTNAGGQPTVAESVESNDQPTQVDGTPFGFATDPMQRKVE